MARACSWGRTPAPTSAGPSFAPPRAMSFKLPIALAAIVTLSTLGVRPTRATLLVASPIAQRASRADSVVVGHVETTEAIWDGGRIVTRARISTVSSLKGGAPGRIDVIVPGGTVDGIGMRVLGAAELRPGERDVLFLGPPRVGDGARRIVDLRAGVLAVERGSDGIDRVRDDTGVIRTVFELAAEVR